MKKAKIVKCRFSHCSHESKELNIEDAVKSGKSSYYHKDCYEVKENIAKIADTFLKRVNANTPYAVLIRTINNIVFDKQVDSNFLLFALEYHLAHNKPLRYPQGLHYVISNDETIKAYEVNKKQNFQKQQYVNNVFAIEESEKNTFTVNNTKKQSGFEAILGK